MHPAIGQQLTQTEVKRLERLATHPTYSIYKTDDEQEPLLLAIDQQSVVLGRFDFVEVEDTDRYQLAHMNVDERYQGQGIGKAIITAAVAYWDAFDLPSTSNRANYYFTGMGLPFINSCFSQNILTEPPFTKPV